MKLTHKEVVRLCQDKAVFHGWHVLPVTSFRRIQDLYLFRPDLVMARGKDESICAFEVKPSSTGYSELMRGFGQCVSYRAFLHSEQGVIPHLVVPARLAGMATWFCACLRWVYLTVYNEEGRLVPIHTGSMFADPTSVSRLEAFNERSNYKRECDEMARFVSAIQGQATKEFKDRQTDEALSRMNLFMSELTSSFR